MKLSFTGTSEQDGAKFWLNRIGWTPSESVKKIAQENNPTKTSYVADIGGGHGRETLWLAEQGFLSILIEPNKYSLEFAKKRANSKKLNIILVNAALPYLPIGPQIVDVVEFYWTLHQIPDEFKLLALKEIYRILKPQ